MGIVEKQSWLDQPRLLHQTVRTAAGAKGAEMSEMEFIVRVFGYSDDLVDIEGSSYSEYEIDCFDRDVRLWFDDGTVILVSYSNDGIWKIKVENRGDAPQKLTVCEDEDADLYSDVFEINAEVVKHQVIRKR